MDINRAMEGKPAIAWEPDKSSYIGVMPRTGNVEEITWYEDDPCFVFHPMNSYTDGNKIIADVMQFEAAPLFPYADGSPGDPKKAESKLNRWEIDLTSNSNNVKKNYLDEHLGEFPRIDERYSMMNYRHGYFAAGIGDRPEDMGFNSIAHYDHKTSKKDYYTLSERDAVGEPVFVPKEKDSKEGDGYLIATCYRGEENRSDLLIMDAKNISEGPIAVAKLPHRIPYGFHGNWKPGN